MHMAVELARRSGLSNAEIAKLLGMNPRSVPRAFPRIDVTDFPQDGEV